MCLRSLGVRPSVKGDHEDDARFRLQVKALFNWGRDSLNVTEIGQLLAKILHFKQLNLSNIHARHFSSHSRYFMDVQLKL